MTLTVHAASGAAQWSECRRLFEDVAVPVSAPVSAFAAPFPSCPRLPEADVARHHAPTEETKQKQEDITIMVSHPQLKK